MITYNSSRAVFPANDSPFGRHCHVHDKRYKSIYPHDSMVDLLLSSNKHWQKPAAFASAAKLSAPELLTAPDGRTQNLMHGSKTDSEPAFAPHHGSIAGWRSPRHTKVIDIFRFWGSIVAHIASRFSLVGRTSILYEMRLLLTPQPIYGLIRRQLGMGLAGTAFWHGGPGQIEV